LQRNQTTLALPIHIEGIGVHTGQTSKLELRPAPIDHGIVFIRTQKNGEKHRLPATTDQSRPSDLCTILETSGARIETIEHLMAALHACGIDNLEIEASHHEVPILDGSAQPFVQELTRAGIVSQAARQRYLRITKPLRHESGLAWAKFLPADQDFPVCRFDISIDFSCPLIGQQQIAFDMNFNLFVREIASARTFGFLKEAEMLRARGLARGASLKNCLVIGEDDHLLEGQNLRFEDEFVRHKALDAIGDTALLGLPFIGIFRSHRPSHRLNGEIVKKLLASPEHFEIK